jgi:RHS repeat-associated protein
VRRIVGGVETWMIYGLGGELLAEYPANGAVGSPQKEYGYRDGQLLIVAQTAPFEIRWLVADHLESPRMNVRGTGADGGSLASVTRHDYLPFGEELISGVGIRGSGYSYEPPADGVRQKFGSKERDNETGLDIMQARYYGSVQGRFASGDPFERPSSLFRPLWHVNPGIPWSIGFHLAPRRVATNDFSRAFQRADAAGGIIASRQRRLKSTGPLDSSVADATPFSRGARDRALKRTAKFRRRYATAEREMISLLAYAWPKR